MSVFSHLLEALDVVLAAEEIMGINLNKAWHGLHTNFYLFFNIYLYLFI